MSNELSDEDREALELDAAYRCGHTGAVAAIYTKRLKRLQDRAERAERERDELQARLDKWAKAERWTDHHGNHWVLKPEGEE
jgi:hypothetical protein